MAIKLKPVKDQVIVVTGASSGIGLATAELAASRGAKVVLAARNSDALAEVERGITAAGGSAISVGVDVSKRDDIDLLARVATERFGGFDSWVNNAGLSILGKLEEIDEADSRQLFDINFWGLVNGSLVAAKHLKTKGGAIVNLGSVASDVALPLQSMYSASKHAIKGFTDGLRMELGEEGAPVSVTLIKPAAIDTPFVEHAKNLTGQAAKLPPPVYPPEEVAKAIVYACETPERDIYVGGAGRMMSALGHQAPGVMDWLGRNVLMPQQTQNKPAGQTRGSLDRPMADGQVRGGHPGYVRKVSLYTRAVRHTTPLGVALAAAAGVAAIALLGASGEKS